MQPALSVVLLTTLIGAGQGLFLALVAAHSGAAFGLLAPAAGGSRIYLAGVAAVLSLMGGGLIASFFHLGRPERAWRTAAKWRTSWLSREVIVLPAFTGVAFLYGLAHWLGRAEASTGAAAGIDAALVVGWVGALLALALFVCTAMIYACLRFLAEWHSPLTVVNYVLLGSASGFTLASALAARLEPGLLPFFLCGALVLTALGLASRVASLARNDRLRPRSSLQTAIGVKHPRIVQKSQGFMGGSFNTREFFHGRSRAVLRSMRWLFLAGAFAVPLALLAGGLAGAGGTALALAFVVQYLGLMAERWYFFAQANHPQNLYYQALA